MHNVVRRLTLAAQSRFSGTVRPALSPPIAVMLAVLAAGSAISAGTAIPVASVARRPVGQTRHASYSDLQGTWTNGTATPLERPLEFAGRARLTDPEALDYARTAYQRLIKSLPDRERVGIDPDGTYVDTSTFAMDRGRTSLIVEPNDGRLPRLLPAGERRVKAAKTMDGPEALTLEERCLLGTTLLVSRAAPPMVPHFAGQNYYQIVQTADYVMIFTEVVHDARIIRIGGHHLPTTIRRWLGDSVGHWEGATLVVDTTNFTGKTSFRGASDQLHVVERFRRVDASTIEYRATVSDPDTWATSWIAEIPFKATNTRIFEYACHEANYSMKNMLRGARAQEKQKP
jgi:hypothetical protein